MKIRKLTARDAEAMAHIHAGSFERPWPALDMSVHTERDLCLGLDSPLKCFVILGGTDLHAEILTLATHSDHRGTGLATDLLSQSIAKLKSSGCQEIFLEVAEDNQAARALYKKLGFVPVGRRPGYYRRANGRMAAITYSLRV